MIMMHYTKKGKLSIVIIVIFALLIMQPAIAASQSNAKKLVVIGTAKIDNGDIVKARNQAIISSMISAVFTTALDLLSPEIVIKNFKTINESILGNPDRFIQNYRVLTAEEHGEDYRVIVEATVITTGIKNYLAATGLTSDTKRLPGLLLMITPENIAESIPSEFLDRELEIAKKASADSMKYAFRNRGFPVIEPFQVEAELKKILSGDDATGFDVNVAISIGKKLKADVVIIGVSSAEMKHVSEDEPVGPVKGTVSAKAFRTNNGEEIGETIQSAVEIYRQDIPGATRALADAGTLAADALAAQIASALEEKSIEISQFKIIIEKATGFSDVLAFRGKLKDIPIIKEFRTKEIKSDGAVLEIDSETNAKELAEALMKMPSFDSFHIEIIETSENTIKIRFIPN